MARRRKRRNATEANAKKRLLDVSRTGSSGPDEDTLPTAIVIRNIPLSVKKERLVQIMTEKGLPLPYAFNSHFENGVLRSFAFANFTDPDEAATVINKMDGLELDGKMLRVEHKKS